jgi:vitamin B12 transporter
MFRIILFLFFFTPLFTPLFAEEILVTAEKVQRQYEYSTSSILSLDQDDIEDSNAETVSELLSGHAGISIHHSGVYGKQSSVFLRGTENRHTLVLIDGVEVNDVTGISGEARLEFLDLEDVARVEVLKGSQSVLYGPQAIGGVIKITTKKGSKEKKSRVKVGYGSYNNKRFGFTNSGERKKLNYRLSGHWQDVEGISAFNEKKTVGADKDSYSNLTLSSQLSYNALAFQGRFQKAHYLYDGFNADSKTNTSTYGSELLSLSYSKKLYPTIKLSRYHVRSDLFGGNFHFLYEGDNKKIEVVDIFFYGESNLVVGAEYEKEEAKALDSLFTEAKTKESYAVYANNYLKLDSFFIDQGLRFDSFQFFNDEVTYRLGSGYFIENLRTTIKGSFSKGIKAPSLYNTWSQFGGNRDIEPETSLSKEVGLLWKGSTNSLELTYFRIDYKKLIDFVNNKYDNTGDFEVYGFETEAKILFLEDFLLRPSATLLRTRNKETGAYLARRPRFMAGAHFQYFLNEEYSMALNGKYQGARNDTSGIRLPSYGLYKYTLSRRWDEQSLNLELGNLLDKEYEEINNFGTRGRNIQLTYRMNL